jgi:AcrR family transcriptional regulator
LGVLPLFDDTLLVDGDGAAEAPGAALGLRERKKRQARAAIADAALELFAEKGFDDTTVAEVAVHAGVSPATVARYYPTKESLLFADVGVKAPALRAAVLARPASESPYTALVAALSAGGVGHDPEHRRRLMLSRRAIASSPVLRGRAATFMDVWRDAVTEMVVARGSSPEEARVLATVVTALLDDVARRWAADGGADDLPTLIAEAFAALARTHRRPA